MSGIAGIVNLDGAPVERALVDRFERFLHSRGPDGQGQWIEANVALVHTLFATTDESLGERQPLSLDGSVRIVADARIDARDDLIRELTSRGRDCSRQRPDAELILHAYAVWGESCVEHLLGDFAFAIWDARERKLFCARDHFGVRPFFYAHVKGTVVFSNAIDVPRVHPDVSDDLCEPAIADFLVLGYNYDVTRTVHESIRRLAPAHVLVVADGQVRTRRYWSLPVDSEIVLHRSRDYVEQFQDLLEQAVADRLRTDRVAVLMSGGLDSSSIAAVASRAAVKNGMSVSISAHTMTYRRLIPYEEAHFARVAAREIGIPWNEFLLDDKELFAFRDQPKSRPTEPGRWPLFDWTLADALGDPLPARVVLTGQGSDGIFSSLRLRHCRNRIRDGRWLRLAGETSRYLLSEGRFRRLQLRGHVHQWFGRGPRPQPFPTWLNRDFERRLNLRDRYKRCGAETAWNAAPEKAVRPEAYGLVSSPIWPGIFDDYDLDSFGGCAEVRHPFFDLRLVRYTLGLPALPWCTDKELLRRSMRGLLANEVRLRRKQPVMSDLLMAHYRNSDNSWLEDFRSDERLCRFVDVERMIDQLQDPQPHELTVHLRPIRLNYWLKWESEYAYKMREEESGVQPC